MTLSRDLFLSILSMDSYNRGYGSGVGTLAESGQLGNATIRAFGEDEQQGWQAAGFYALAYDMTGMANSGQFADGERVIAYRGTDSFLGQDGFWRAIAGLPTNLPSDNDIFNGYGVAFGHPDGLHARLSIDFYRAVAGAALEEANITLTGHSLGAANDNALHMRMAA